jgi:hypothetical protein
MDINVSTFGQFGAPPVTSFSDTLAVANNATNLATPNNTNWIQVPLNSNTAFSSPTEFVQFQLGQLLSGGGGTGLKITMDQMAANPTYCHCQGIMPRPLVSSTVYYNAKKKFVQFTYNAQSSIAAGVGFFNFECNSGTGVGHDNATPANDASFFRIDLGNFQRSNSGAAVTTLQANAGLVESQGDVFRISMDASVAGVTSWTLLQNGINFWGLTINDNAANRFNGNGWPVIWLANGVAASFLEMKNFSTGLGA